MSKSNYQNIKGKKLLLLGGPALACDIIKTAREMGIHTSVTDFYPPEKSPAKLVADKYYMVSNADVDAVVKLIREEKIDGVLTGFTDSTLPYYEKICRKAGVPSYASSEQINITCNKNAFKKLCKNFEVPVVEEYDISSPYDIEEVKKLRFPVILKPADNSGGRGITICNKPNEFSAAYEHALNFSESKSVLTERYMMAPEVSIFYLVKDGEIYLTLMGDRHTKNRKQGIIPLPVGYTFPSRNFPAYLDNLNEKVVKMFESIGMKNGLIFIQSFVEDGHCIFYEMGFRITGSLEYKLIEALNGFNPLRMLIEFAVTGKMGSAEELQHNAPNHSSSACNLTFLVNPGVIGSIRGVKEVKEMEGIIDAVLSYKEGDEVPKSAVGTLRQVLLRVFAIGKNDEILVDLVKRIQSSIKVFSDRGENMLMDLYDPQELLNKQKKS